MKKYKLYLQNEDGSETTLATGIVSEDSTTPHSETEKESAGWKDVLRDEQNASKLTADEIAKVFGIPPHLVCEIFDEPRYKFGGNEFCSTIENFAVEKLQKIAQAYLDADHPGKYKVVVSLKENSVAGSNPAGVD